MSLRSLSSISYTEPGFNYEEMRSQSKTGRSARKDRKKSPFQAALTNSFVYSYPKARSIRIWTRLRVERGLFGDRIEETP